MTEQKEPKNRREISASGVILIILVSAVVGVGIITGPPAPPITLDNMIRALPFLIFLILIYITTYEVATYVQERNKRSEAT